MEAIGQIIFSNRNWVYLLSNLFPDAEKNLLYKMSEEQGLFVDYPNREGI
jgi:hypothetical protein